MKNSDPIFQGPEMDKDGNGVAEVGPDGQLTGYLTSDYGTFQRRQRSIPDKGRGSDVLAEYRDTAEKTIREVLDVLDKSLPDDDNLYLSRPNLLANLQGKRQLPVCRQGWHTDHAEDQWGVVAIGAVQKTSLLVFPGSAAEIREFQRLERLVTQNKIAEAELEAWLRGRAFKALRLVLQPGDMVFMTGDTIHAGDRGTNGSRSMRMHWYITQSTAKDNSTTHLEHYGESFKKCFR